MSVSLSRLTVGSTLAAVALVVALPSAALAGTGSDGARPGSGAGSSATPAPGSAGGAAAGRSAATSGGKQPAADKPAAQRPAGRDDRGSAERDGRGRSEAHRDGRADRRPDARPGDRRKGRPASADRRDGSRSAKAGAPRGHSADAAKGGADPRGNNGTFKVDGPVLDTSHGNEPHVSCAFRLNFFGYDAGQLGTIVFTPVAPTPGAATTVNGQVVLSTTAAQGGAYGGSYPATGTWTATDLGLDPTQAHHVKVSVEALNADGSDVPGGAKHKVFWIEPCGAAPAATVPAGSADVPFIGPVALPAGGAAEVAPSVAVAGTTADAAAQPATVPFVRPVAPLSGGFLLSARASTASTLVAAPAGAAAGATVAAPATLPFTGSPQLLALAVGALVAGGTGAALVMAGRRTA